MGEIMSEKIAHAGAIAGALLPAERSLNKAAIDLLAVGTRMFEARNSGTFHPLEGQRAVERLGSGMSKLVEAIGDVARAHDEFVKVAVKHEIMEGSGDVCPVPTDPHGEHVDQDNVVLMPVAA
jgi:hypothetical protein